MAKDEEVKSLNQNTSSYIPYIEYQLTNTKKYTESIVNRVLKVYEIDS